MRTGDHRWSREELLDLFAKHLPLGRQSVRQIQDELAVSHRGSFRTPGKILIILFASRAGSNYLGQLLSSTGWFNEIGESFAPHQLTKVRDRYGLRDVHESAQWMIDHRGTDRAFGFKGGFYVLAGAAEVGFLEEVIDRAQFILLRRRDRVAQAVSLVKGKMSGQMHSLQPVQRQLTDEDYDEELIVRQVRQIHKSEQGLADFVELLGKTAPLYYYEDICADPSAHVMDICKLMHIEVPHTYDPNEKVRLSILRDDLSARWVGRFRQERPDLH